MYTSEHWIVHSSFQKKLACPLQQLTFDTKFKTSHSNANPYNFNALHCNASVSFQITSSSTNSLIEFDFCLTFSEFKKYLLDSLARWGFELEIPPLHFSNLNSYSSHFNASYFSISIFSQFAIFSDNLILFCKVKYALLLSLALLLL